MRVANDHGSFVISNQTLQRLADEGNALAALVIRQRERIKELQEVVPTPTEQQEKLERIIRDLQRENDRLRFENAGLRSHG